MDDEALLALAADLAQRAAATILAIRAKGFETLRKADDSPVTAADQTSERIIAEGLRAATPAIPVIAEEEAAAGRDQAATHEFWLVDPLDGTREFAAGRDQFTVNIGLVREGRAVLGVVAVPALGEMFGGIVGRGAWRRDAAGEHPIATRAPSSEGLTVLASRHSGKDPRLLAYLGEQTIASLANFGSSLKFCRLAEGRADLYPRFGRTMEWDTAAPQAVLEAAGGHVRTVEGEPLRYGKPGWENPSFICTGR